MGRSCTHKYGRVPDVKTTIELPDELLREAKATAARQGSSLKEVLTAALQSHLARPTRAVRGKEAWRSVVGRATPAAVAAIDQVIADELESVDLETWR
jgi:hypothetical protein